MTVEQLVKNLGEVPLHCDVMIAYESGVRMVAEKVGMTERDGRLVVVITDKDEWEDREHW